MAGVTAETGLTDGHIVDLSQKITCESELVNLGVKVLKLPEFIIKAAIYNKNEIQDAAHEVLHTWLKKQSNREEAFNNLQSALLENEMNLLAAELRSWRNGETASQKISLSRKATISKCGKRKKYK